MKGFLSAVDTVNKWAGRLVGYLVLVIITITVLEVVLRFAFNKPTNWVYETSGQLFGFYLIIGGGYVLLNKAHVRVDVLWSRLSARKQAITDLVTSIFAFLFLGVTLWFTIRMAWISTLQMERDVNTSLLPPIWPLKICIAIGVLLLLLQLIAKFMRDFYLATKGREYV